MIYCIDRKAEEEKQMEKNIFKQVIAKQAQDMSQNSAETWDFRILGVAKN